MLNGYSKLWPFQGGDVCLADLCDVLHCDYLATKMDLEGTHEHRSYDENAYCDPDKAVKLRLQCVVSLFSDPGSQSFFM